jgi:hypothetical protein
MVRFFKRVRHIIAFHNSICIDCILTCVLGTESGNLGFSIAVIFGCDKYVLNIRPAHNASM